MLCCRIWSRRKLYNNGTEKFRTNAGGAQVFGALYSGDSTPHYFGDSNDLQIYHSGTHSYIDDTGTGNVYIRGNNTLFIQGVNNEDKAKFTTGGGVELYNANSKKFETSSTGVSITGALVASGDVTAFSDARLKTDIHTINNALGTVGKLRGVNYKWLKDGKQSTGLIAQEVEAVIPEIVHTNQLDGEEVKSIDYGKLVGVLIEAVKELKAELDEHKAGGK